MLIIPKLALNRLLILSINFLVQTQRHILTQLPTAFLLIPIPGFITIFTQFNRLKRRRGLEKFIDFWG
jgi:hypothetical protein